jgi:WD40 repeat protein
MVVVWVALTMSYCLNPNCKKPHNPSTAIFCQSCGARLHLSDRYRAIRVLGQGGFGRTLLAEDEYKPSHPRCVIKQLYLEPQRHTSKAIALFHQEAICLEQLGEHPQIPELLAHFEQDGHQYIVQEFIDGDNLAQELNQQGAFQDEQIHQILHQLLPVLQFIHQGRVIHRDIKPENIIRRRSDQRLVLVDFGAAKYASAIALAKTGTAIGSAMYAAPEQIQGKALFASDLYSLGITCIHLLTEMLPFDLYDPVEGTFVWRHYLHHNPVSDELAHILNKMVRPIVKQRYQSAGEVLQAIDRVSLSRRSSAFAIFPKPAESSDRLDRVPDCLSDRQPIQPADAFRSTLRCAEPPLTLRGHRGKVYSIAFSPDGQLLVSGSGDETIKLWDSSTGKLIHTFNRGWWSGHSNLVSAVVFSPDGQMFASASWDKTVKLWSLYTGRWRHALSEYPHVANAIAFSPDGRLLASGGSATTIKLWDVQTGQLLRQLRGHSRLIQAIAFSPDGQTLASGSADTTIKLWHVRTGEERCTLKGHSSAVISLAFSPDGQYLASGAWDSFMVLWQVQTGQLHHALLDHSGYPHSLRFSLNGQRLIGSSACHTIQCWDVMSQQSCGVLEGHQSWINAVAVNPEGTYLASGSSDHTIQIWRWREAVG